MKVNENINFTKYQSDTETTLKERIAAFVDSSVFWTDYIVNDKADNILYSEIVTAVNVPKQIKLTIAEYSSFIDVETDFAHWINNDEEKLNALAKIFVIYYIEVNGESLHNKLLLENIFFNPEGTDFNYDFIEQSITNTYTILRDIESLTRENKKKSKKQSEEMEKINNLIDVESDINTTDFLQTAVSSNLIIKTENPLVLSHIFNDLNFDNILFASYDKYFKIFDKNRHLLKKYDYDSNIKENTLSCVFYKNSKFQEISIKKISFNEFNIQVDVVDNGSAEEEVKRILQLNDFTVIKINKTNIKGEFFILNEYFHKELFLDEVMNNVSFFNMYVNESQKVTKNSNRLHFYFYTINTNRVVFTMNQDNDNIKINITRLESYEKLDFFKTVFESLFKTYKSKEKYLFDIYKKYIPSMTLEILKQDDDRPKRIGGRDLLKEKEPTLFVALYTRKCARPPRIIEDDEQIPENQMIMEFPIKNEGGLKPRKYICDTDPKFKYPGLRKNSLSNSDVFKYIPCCYETNQQLRKGSPWNAYFEGETAKNDKYEHLLYKTLRVVPNGTRGVLPLGLSKLFGKTIMRSGVYVSPNSFIDAVDRAINGDKVKILSNRLEKLKNIRAELKYVYCLQENADICNGSEWFYDVNSYFDPKRFYRSVEEYYKTNIYLFERNADKAIGYSNGIVNFVKYNDAPEGVLTIPNIPENGLYVDSKKFKRDVYIYIHMGGAVDMLEYPHCEYIIIKNNVHETIENIYRYMLIRSYDTKQINIAEQYVDSTGRVIKDENNVNLHQQPINAITHKINPVKTTSYLNNHVYLKRLGRILTEYVAIKYVSSMLSLDEFFDKFITISDNAKYTYAKFNNNYLINYYDTYFLNEDGMIELDSLDTKKDLKYLLEKMEIFKLLPQMFKPVLESYYDNYLDYSNNVVSENAFKEFAFGEKQGYAMNNFLEPPKNNFIIVKHDYYNDLNGYFKVVNKESIDLENNFLNSIEEDKYYLWTKNKFVVVSSKDSHKGNIIIVFKINAITHYLFKISDF